MTTKIFSLLCLLLLASSVNAQFLHSGTAPIDPHNKSLAGPTRSVNPAQRSGQAQRVGPGRSTQTFRARQRTGESALSNPVAPAPVFMGDMLFSSGGWSARNIVVADFNGDGQLDLAVVNYCGDSNCSHGSVTVLLGNRDGTFQAAVSYPSGGDEARAVAAGDFNHDGKIDLAVVNQNCMTVNCLSGSLSILLGKGDGTFQAGVSYDSGGDGISIATGDLNGDGNLDIVVTNYQANNIGVLLGRGDGTFQPVVSYPSGGTAPNSVVLWDFNGDGRLDLAVVNLCTDIEYSNGSVGVRLGNGDGTFQPIVFYDSGDTCPMAAAVADFNGDRKPDLAVLNGLHQTVGVLLGKGDGTFQAAVSSPSEEGASSLAVADFNRDGNADLVVANTCSDGVCYAHGSVGVLLGKGDGTFQSAGAYDSGGVSPSYVAVGDFNGDGFLDFVVSNYSPDNPYGQSPLRVLVGEGTGQFQTPAIYSPSGSGGVIADFNGDGKPDVAVLQVCPNNDCSQGTISVFLGKEGGTLQPPVTSPLPFRLFAPSLVAGDFNRDGKIDLVIANQCDKNCGTVSVWQGNGAGTFHQIASYAVGGSGALTVTGDFNRDGKLDLAVADQCGMTCTDGSVHILLGNGDGTFQAATTYPSSANGSTSIVVGDLNGDGNLDLVLVDLSFCVEDQWDNCVSPLGTVTVLLGRGDGTFEAPVHYGSGAQVPLSVALGDFNGDGKLDLAVTHCPLCASLNNAGNTDVVGVLLGNGDGTFQTAITADPGISQGSNHTVAVSDLNGDGNLDLLLTNFIMLGNGDGTFQSPLFYPTSEFGQLGEIADFNGDGKPDLILFGSQRFTILLNITPGFRYWTSSAITSSVNPAGLNQPVTFTATVSPGFGLPMTGTITFHDGTLALATLPITNGQAQFSTSTLNDGAHSLTARYEGDANFVPSSSKLLEQLVTSAVDFVVTTSSPSATVSAGSSTSYTLNLRTLNGFSNAVSLACSGLPAGANCSFSPASPITLTASGTSETVTISTTGATMAGTYTPAHPGMSRSPSASARKLLSIYLLWLPLPAIALAGMRFRPHRWRRFSSNLMCVLVIASTVLLASCGGNTSSSGGGGSNPSTPAGSYSVTVTATSGSLTHATVLTLTVQ